MGGAGGLVCLWGSYTHTDMHAPLLCLQRRLGQFLSGPRSRVWTGRQECSLLGGRWEVLDFVRSRTAPDEEAIN